MKKMLFVIACITAAGCVKVPTIVMVDRKTALEEQVDVGFAKQQGALVQAGLSPRPVPYTKGQLEAKGIHPAGSTFDVVLRPYRSYITDQEQLDDLLVRRCVGEATDCTVQETRQNCVGKLDEAAVTRLLQRVNLHRRQVLALLGSKTGQPVDVIRSAYRKHILDMLVCGGQYQDKDGKWEVKRCD